MFIKEITKKNTKTGKAFHHYRLVESYRIGGKIRHRTILNLGEVVEIQSSEDRKMLANRIEEIINKQNAIFSPPDAIERLARKFAAQIIEHNLTDDQHSENQQVSDFREVDLNTVASDDAREIGAEWMCKQMAEELDIRGFLSRQGWNNKWATLGEISIISKAIFASSEHKTAHWLATNSGLAELYGQDYDKINRHQLYKASSLLYEEKDGLEEYFSTKTAELFDLQDRIMLYDLTNTYFEGRKQESEKAGHGRSKEKRNDAKLMVLAMVVDIHGFVKYSRFYEGNMADGNTLVDTIRALEQGSSPVSQQRVVVLDAGIASEDNLAFLRKNNYDYLCVSRSQLPDYQAHIEQEKMVYLSDNRENPIELQKIEEGKGSDTWLYVHSRQKQVKESAMEEKLKGRYLEGLQAIEAAIHKKNGVKKPEKVWERIGRLKEKYPRVSKFFDIKVEHNNKAVTAITWQILAREDEKQQGVYFLRTTLNTDEESNLWWIYNTLREIEATFRVLKTDLNLRPVFHQKDIYCEAHLFLGILAYQLVCAIRHRLGQKGIHQDWQNIVRTMNSQKVLTTSMKGQKENYFIRHCTRPTPEVLEIYKALGQNSMPFKNKKSVVPH